MIKIRRMRNKIICRINNRTKERRKEEEKKKKKKERKNALLKGRRAGACKRDMKKETKREMETKNKFEETSSSPRPIK